MNALFRVAIGAAILAFVPVSVFAQTASLRHLVYTFQYGSSQTQHQTQSILSAGTGSATNSGSTDFGGTASDRGTITVDIMGMQSNQGLVVQVSEQARNGRTMDPLTCVVYASTLVTCQNGKMPNDEGLAVIRLLHPAFADPQKRDAQQHWRSDLSGTGVSDITDFNAAKGSDGKDAISEQHVVKITRGQNETVTASNKIGYDDAKVVPDSISQYTTIRQEGGPGGYTTLTTDIQAELQSDSRG